MPHHSRGSGAGLNCNEKKENRKYGQKQISLRAGVGAGGPRAERGATLGTVASGRRNDGEDGAADLGHRMVPGADLQEGDGGAWLRGRGTDDARDRKGVVSGKNV